MCLSHISKCVYHKIDKHMILPIYTSSCLWCGSLQNCTPCRYQDTSFSSPSLSDPQLGVPLYRPYDTANGCVVLAGLHALAMSARGLKAGICSGNRPGDSVSVQQMLVGGTRHAVLSRTGVRCCAVLLTPAMHP